MVDRSRIWSKAQRWTMAMLAPTAVVAASVGGTWGAADVSEFIEQHRFLGFSDSDTLPVDDASVAGAAADPLDAGFASTPWQWSGASPGNAQTVFLTIEPRIYPVNGLRWFFNGGVDRHDLLGPLDSEFGLWHSSTRALTTGDIVSACWVGRDGVKQCQYVVVG